ncbi:hypothetical protein [Aureivirga sp. CE67]|uniref:hypothetical protein n=1 Tax=Aureivirga sp. CE67 TaxID=1788983 RepID=UPI0018CABEBA|nr:hypothetical protein [Aureivirga sp. CE67]
MKKKIDLLKELNPSTKGRVLILNYLIAILAVFCLLGLLFFTRDTLRFFHELKSGFLSEPIYFSIQILLNLCSFYFFTGSIGKDIFEENKSPRFSVFKGFLKMSFLMLLIAMFSEIIYRTITYGFDLEFLLLDMWIWLISGIGIFIIPGGILGFGVGFLIEKQFLRCRKLSKIFIVFILLGTTISSCAIEKLNYNREKLISLNSKNFKVFLDGTEIEMKNYLLNKKKIEEIVLNRKKKRIDIYQKYDTKYISTNVLYDSLVEKDDLWWTLLDGVPDSDSLMIDVSEIKSYRIKEVKNNTNIIICRPLKPMLYLELNY